MRRLVLALGITALVCSPALAGKNAGGAMVVHTDDTHSWTSDVCDSFDTWYPDILCSDLSTQTNRDESTAALIWFIAAFHETADPGVTVCYFGNDHNLPAGHHNGQGFCGPAGTIEVPDSGWPDNPGTAGNSVAFGSPVVGDLLFPFYWFDVRGYTGVNYCSGINPVGGYAAFVDDSSPPQLDQIDNFGCVRWYVAGFNDCPQSAPAEGACCAEDGTCTVTADPDCHEELWIPGETCDPNPCPQQPQACCADDGTCTFSSPDDCAGTPWGAGTDCDPNPCPQPPQACCFDDGQCTFVPPDECAGTPWGEGTDCDPNPCGKPFVRGDTNADGAHNVRDLTYFMAARRMPDPPCRDAADFDDSGNLGLSDILGLLAFLFEQGPPPAPPYPDCGYDPTEDNLNCKIFPPCEPERLRPLSDDRSFVGPPEGAIQLLGSKLSQDGTLLVVPITLRSSRDLAAFEFTVNFDPAVLQFAGLDEAGRQSGSLDFFAAKTEGISGCLRVGGIPDLRFESLCQAGTQQLGRLIFQTRGASGVEDTQIRVTDGILITDELSAFGVTRSEMIVSFDAAGERVGSNAEPRLTFANPLRPGSVISLDLPVASPVTVAIYSVGGQIVRTLTEDLFPSGHHELNWDGQTELGQEAAPGIYYVRATLGTKQIHRTIALVR